MRLTAELDLRAALLRVLDECCDLGVTRLVDQRADDKFILQDAFQLRAAKVRTFIEFTSDPLVNSTSV